MNLEQLKAIIRDELTELVTTHLIGEPEDTTDVDDETTHNRSAQNRISTQIARRTTWSVLPESFD